jgi:hypothetical protein
VLPKAIDLSGFCDKKKVLSHLHNERQRKLTNLFIVMLNSMKIMGENSSMRSMLITKLDIPEGGVLLREI